VGKGGRRIEWGVRDEARGECRGGDACSVFRVYNLHASKVVLPGRWQQYFINASKGVELGSEDYTVRCTRESAGTASATRSHHVCI
jgi:hypothetical protein